MFGSLVRHTHTHTHTPISNHRLVFQQAPRKKKKKKKPMLIRY